MCKIKYFLTALFVTTILAGCNLLNLGEAESKISSRLISKAKTPEINSPTVGIEWTHGAAATNITQNWSGYGINRKIYDPYVVKKDDIYHLWFSLYERRAFGDYYSIIYAQSKDGINWYSVSSNNTALPPTDVFGSDDRLGARVGSVIWDEESQEFKMWYRGLSEDSEGNRVWKILFAKSIDGSRNWVKYPNTSYDNPDNSEPLAVIERVNSSDRGTTPYDDEELGDLTVVKEKYYTGNQFYQCYKIWYAARGALTDNDPANYLPDEADVSKYRINYATSGNGLDWYKKSRPVLVPNIIRSDYSLDTVPEFAPFDGGGKNMPVIIKDLYRGQYIYKMWYLGTRHDDSSVKRLGLATSGNGEIFSYYKDTRLDYEQQHLDAEYDPALNPYEQGLALFPHPDNFRDPAVIRDGNLYKMWYVVDDGLDSRIHYVESW